MHTVSASLDALRLRHLTSRHGQTVPDALPLLARILGLTLEEATRLVGDGPSLVAVDRRLATLHAASDLNAAAVLADLEAFFERYACQYTLSLAELAGQVVPRQQLGAVRLVVHDLGDGRQVVHPEAGVDCDHTRPLHDAEN